MGDRRDHPTKICPVCFRIEHISTPVCDGCGYEFPQERLVAAAGLGRVIAAFNSLRDDFAELHARYIDSRTREEIEHALFRRADCARPRRSGTGSGRV